MMNPQHSLRKVFGLYEHELNHWLDRALPRVDLVLDVGANDGYFTFGCAAAFHRMNKKSEIIGFEPQAVHVSMLRNSIAAQNASAVGINIIHAFVGRQPGESMTTLDSLPVTGRENTLIKIDVEGAEMEVIAGAASWITPSNFFLIEVHEQAFLQKIRNTFAGQGCPLMQVDQHPLPLLGREMRSKDNWWLVSNFRSTNQT